MKKFNIFLVLIATFFIGNISVKALECKYSDGTVQITIKDGSASSEQANITMSSHFNKQVSKCPDRIWGYCYYPYPGAAYKYYIIYDTEYTTDANVQSYDKSAFEYINESQNTGTTNIDGTVSCGHGVLKNIPSRLVKIVNIIVRIIQIGIPILLIILGMIDFAKSLVAQKEDEMKKSQRTFVSRLITAIMVFLVIFVAKVAIRFVADKSESSTVLSCVDCFISGIDRCE